MQPATRFHHLGQASFILSNATYGKRFFRSTVLCVSRKLLFQRKMVKCTIKYRNALSTDRLYHRPVIHCSYISYCGFHSLEAARIPRRMAAFSFICCCCRVGAEQRAGSGGGPPGIKNILVKDSLSGRANLPGAAGLFALQYSGRGKRIKPFDHWHYYFSSLWLPSSWLPPMKPWPDLDQHFHPDRQAPTA